MGTHKKLITWMSLVGIIAVMAMAVGTMAPGVAEANVSKPGISLPYCTSDGMSMYWHTKDYGTAAAPDGWKVERRHHASGRFETKTWEFIDADSDALQTYNDTYWDWIDRSASNDVSYTYRVRAINSDGRDMAGRSWSRRAPTYCP